MPRPSHLSPDNILRFLQVRKDPASTDEIARGLRLSKADRRPLTKMLNSLKKRGSIKELPGGRYHLSGLKPEGEAQSPEGFAPRSGPQKTGEQEGAPRRDEIAGRLVLHHDG